MKLPFPLRNARAFLLHHKQAGHAASAIQTAALPWRCTKGGKLEILLITSRSSGRWVIPKGWPMRRKDLAEAAAEEAFEEAGVEGRIEPKPIGQFAHMKRLPVLGSAPVKVVVHALAVTRELAEWPERGQRTRRWFSLEDAVGHVASKELGQLIQSFEPVRH